ncbi:MAG TPA: putative baseplate assembly protein [Candidatus Limnocylindrales bacterium]|nr:putative baseplate assembly protein [Candidatus Limnocylindrales bacterium]
MAALADLRTRDDDDFTIALIDAFAVMGDIVTFYSERIANEAFLRTATERRSVLELARLIGYELAPGVAADAYLAFKLDPPLPGTAPRPVPIPARARVQSVPGPGEAPQTFETVEDITGREAWNELSLQTSDEQQITFGQRELTLQGTDHALGPGDVILLVGDERLSDSGSERWDARLLRTATTNPLANTTHVTWLEGLGSSMPRVNPAAVNVRAFVFRQRAAIFGHNAPDPRLMSLSAAAQSALVADITNGVWKGFALSKKSVDLDQSYPKVVPDSWLVLLSEEIPHSPSSLSGYAELYRAKTVGHQSVSDFGLSSKVTRVGFDTAEHLDWFPRRETLVFCQSEELPIALRPVRAPVYGDRLAFAGHVTSLQAGQAITLSGPAQHLRVTVSGAGTTLRYDDGSSRSLEADDRLTLVKAPDVAAQGGLVAIEPDELERQMNPLFGGPRPLASWVVEDLDGRRATAQTAASSFTLDPARKDVPGVPNDEVFAEVAAISGLADAIEDDHLRTRIRLSAATGRVYDRALLRINANVARSTHGETVRELIGSGDGASPNQRLRLRQAPLTYVGADTPSGRASTLEVYVDGARWEGRQSLFEATPDARAYAVEVRDDLSTDVIFGDGSEGARLPTGAGNVRAVYRKGIGTGGNVRAGQLTSLLAGPTGVRSVVNPEDATGGADPESLGEARRGAPRTVLTLGRAVSRRDYEDFAATFAGIAKATASWVALGPNRGVVVTVAGPDGSEVPVPGTTHDRLVRGLQKYGDSTLPVRVLAHRPVTFALGLAVKVDPLREVPPVLDAVRTAMLRAFSFDARSFAQGVAVDEVAAVAHSVPGVVAIDVTGLRRSDEPASTLRPRILVAPTQVSGAGIAAAELLTIDADALTIVVMA